MQLENVFITRAGMEFLLERSANINSCCRDTGKVL